MKNLLKYSAMSAAVLVTMIACSNTSTKKDKATNNLKPKPAANTPVANTPAAVNPCSQIEIGKDYKYQAQEVEGGVNSIPIASENAKFDEATLVSEFNKLDLSKMKFYDKIISGSLMHSKMSEESSSWLTSRNLRENGDLDILATDVEEGIFYGKWLVIDKSMGGTVKLNISCDAKNKVIKTLTTDLEFFTVDTSNEDKTVITKAGPQPENEGYSLIRKVIEKDGVSYVVMLSGDHVLTDEPQNLYLGISKLVK